MKNLRKILKSFWFIHLLIFLWLFALFGFLMIESKPLIFFMTLSFIWAICGGFIRIIDSIENKK